MEPVRRACLVLRAAGPPRPCLCSRGGSPSLSRRSLATSSVSSPRASSSTPVLGRGLSGAHLTWSSLAGQPWPELTFRQVSLGRVARADSPPGRGLGADLAGAKTQLRSCAWLLKPPPPSQPSLPPPPIFRWGGWVLFHSPRHHSGRSSSGETLWGLGYSWALKLDHVYKSSVPHTGDPLRTPLPNLYSPEGPS